MAECEKKLNIELPSRWKFWKHRRYVTAIMAFFGFFNAYTLRGNLSIAIVAMTEDRFENLENGTKINIGPEYNWSNEIQGYVLSSFFYGYITTQLVGGYFANKFGGKIIFGTGIAVTSGLTLITPFLSSSPYILIAVRITEGFFEGVTYPSNIAVWSKWAPPLERTSLSMLASSGSYFGTVVTMPLSALIAEAFGWRCIFYVFGTIGLIWYVLWMFMVSSSPFEDPKISDKELTYIELSMEENPQDKMPKAPIPWKAIASSKAVWAICVSNFCENWGFYTFLTQLPKFLVDIYNFNLSKSGFLSGLPYLAMGLSVPLSGQLADFLLSRNYLKVTRCRKIFNFFGFFSQFCFLMAVTFVSSSAVTVACLTGAVGIGGFAFAAYCTNPLDIAPQYASIILGISNTFGTLPGILSPILCGYIVSDDPTVSEWQVVFYITAGLYLFGALFFVICASGKMQEWSRTPKTNVRTYNSCDKNVEICADARCTI